MPVAPSGALQPNGPNGSAASDAAGEANATAEARYDLDRLERAIGALVSENARLREESLRLRRVLDEKDERILALEGQLLDVNQRRQDVMKRVDELIGQMDALDAQLQQAEPDVS